MRFAITHHTCYHYDADVVLAYNRAHLLPRATSRQQVHQATLHVDPEPDDRWDATDPDGNAVTYFSLERPHRRLVMTARSEVELAEVEEVRLGSGPAGGCRSGEPWDAAAAGLVSALGPESVFGFDSPLVRRSTDLAEYAAPSFPPGRPLLDAVSDLTHRIYEEFHYLPGSTTVSTPTDEVLRRRQGVCQDFAHLAVGCLRSVGLAARYVSGYLETRPPEGEPTLVGAAASHAWCAVALGDGGWLDLDPTNDLVDPTHHVTVAWGRDYGDVAPLNGVIFASGAGSTLEVGVDVVRLL